MNTGLSDIDVRIVLGIVVLLALMLVRLPALRRYEIRAYGFAAVVGFAAFFNFGLQFHQHTDGFLNRWELYHYQLGSKFFPELGYDGLYAASLVAQRQTAPELPVAKRFRNLDTNMIGGAGHHSPRLRDVRARFSDPRWQSFVEDHHGFIENTPTAYWGIIRRDHGYNATPAWTFVARLFDSQIGGSKASLGFLASLDIALLAAMFIVIFRTYGYHTCCLSLAIAGLGFGWKFLYIGSFLRLDWLATTVFGICSLKRERFAMAGAWFGYAAVVRLFPVLFLAGPGLLAVKAWLAGERPRWPIQLAAGFLAVVGLLGVAGGMTGRGFGAWTEFAQNIQVHRATWGTNLIGLDTLFVIGPSQLLTNFREPNGRHSQQEVFAILEERGPGRVLAATVMLGIVGLAVWQAPLAEAAVLGVVAIFALTPASSYYWIMALLVPFRRGNWAPLAVLALATAMYVALRFYSDREYAPSLYALFAWGCATIFVAWLIPAATRQLRSFRA